jgi:hypothetical protein
VQHEIDVAEQAHETGHDEQRGADLDEDRSPWLVDGVGPSRDLATSA